MVQEFVHQWYITEPCVSNLDMSQPFLMPVKCLSGTPVEPVAVEMAETPCL